MTMWGSGAEARDRIRRLDCAESQGLIDFTSVRRQVPESPAWLRELDKLYEIGLKHACPKCEPLGETA